MRHSPLAEINTATISRLQLVWSEPGGGTPDHQGQPLVIENVGGKPVMFLISARPNRVRALDMSDPDSPKQLWSYAKKTEGDAAAVPRWCCDSVNRGVSYAEGKVVFATLDGSIVALDALTGREVWAVKQTTAGHGGTVSSDPIIADHKVVAGFGADGRAPHGLAAYELSTGDLAWQCLGNGSDRDHCSAKTNDANPIARIDGGPAWSWYGYDPELRTLYAATGDSEHGDSALTIVARKIDSGQALWSFQVSPFLQWDYDGVNQNMLVDLAVDGQARKCLVHFDRNGFAYVLDRISGKLIRANKFVPLDWAERIDLKNGESIKVPAPADFARRQSVAACPLALGAKDQQPCAVDPADASKFYCPTNNWCRKQEPQDRLPNQEGAVYVFVSNYLYPEQPGAGKFKKFDVLTGKSDWEIPDTRPDWGGALTTDGGLVFYGSQGGEFRAVDRKTGKILWQRKLGAGAISNPITYTIKGRQYVSVWSGIGTWIRVPINAALDLSDSYAALGATSMARAAALDRSAPGGTLYTFRLGR